MLQDVKLLGVGEEHYDDSKNVEYCAAPGSLEAYGIFGLAAGETVGRNEVGAESGHPSDAGRHHRYLGLEGRVREDAIFEVPKDTVRPMEE